MTNNNNITHDEKSTQQQQDGEDGSSLQEELSVPKSPNNPFRGKAVVLLRTSSVARIPVYMHLRSLGLTLIVVHPIINPSFETCFDHWIVHDTNDVDALDKLLRAESSRLNCTFDAILSFDEYAVYPAACLAVRRGLRPIPFSPEAIQQTNIKSAFRQFCYANGLRSPKSAAIRTPTDDIAEAVKDLTFPVVVKPSPGAGSLLAKLCASLQELRNHAAYMWSVLNSHPDVKHFLVLGTPVHLLVEEYIGGQEVDIDCAIENGVIRFAAISDNFEVVPPYFVEQGGVCPTRLGAEEQHALMDLLRKFVSLHGSSLHGVLHFEAKYDFSRSAAYVIEVNCRLGSAETNTMITTVFGVELGECLVRCGLGLPLSNITEDSHTPRRHCASVNIYPEREGVLAHAEAPTEDKSLVYYSISQKPGAHVSPPPKSFFLLCWMVAEGSTSDAAIANIHRLTQNFAQEIHSAQ